MVKKMSGPKLFLRYAFPCAEDRFHASFISCEDLKLLERIIKFDEEPEVLILQKCFPKAVNNLVNFAESTGKIVWAFETVAEYWRFHHDHSDESRVKTLVVSRINGIIINVGLNFAVINLYGIKLKKYDQVLVHNRVIVEKLEKY